MPGATIDSVSAHDAVLSIEGVPTDITLSSSYRNIQSQFYLLPKGDSLNGYSDLDIAYMKSSKSDETHFYGETNMDIGTTHMELRNDVTTKNALNKIFDEDVGLFFKTDPR